MAFGRTLAVRQRLVLLVVWVALLLMPTAVLAGPTPLVDCGTDPCTFEKLKETVNNIYDLLILIGGAAAVLGIIAAGFSYFLAVFQGADTGRIRQAKTMLGYAILGTIFLLTSYVIVRSVCLALGTTQCPGLG